MSRRVLIIEDSPTTRAVIKVYLVGRQLEFLEAPDGQAGLALAQQHLPEVIIVDLKMPGMDGMTFCRLVRGEQALKKTPIIVLTFSKSPEVMSEALAAGATEFMVKPIDGARLAERIASYLEAHR
jgi:CheY-like chemotaxis protein